MYPGILPILKLDCLLLVELLRILVLYCFANIFFQSGLSLYIAQKFISIIWGGSISTAILVILKYLIVKIKTSD